MEEEKVPLIDLLEEIKSHMQEDLRHFSRDLPDGGVEIDILRPAFIFILVAKMEGREFPDLVEQLHDLWQTVNVKVKVPQDKRN